MFGCWVRLCVCVVFVLVCVVFVRTISLLMDIAIVFLFDK